ncbi:OmpA family protein [Asinibacterium sp. OR53]|uniref:OmpA family protein n=1 Tax=Asinibacterium sp. OR53 TaxID=925409 RepID=UPI00047AA7DF|nr:OmpA family protein [Asinibacterium sp. OR53]
MVKIIKHSLVCMVCTVLVGYLLPAGVQAQNARKIEKKADASFKMKDYYTAAKLYASLLYDSAALDGVAPLYPYQSSNQKAFSKTKSSQQPYVLYQLAESYRLGYHYQEALKPYEQYIATKDTRFPLASLWYGICLNANNQPEKAATVFKDFLKKYRPKDAYAQMARIGLANTDFVIANRVLPPKAVITKIKNLPSGDGSIFALDKINDSTFWFSSSKHEPSKQHEIEYPIRLFSGKFNNDNVQKIAAVSVRDMNMAASSMSADGRTVFFTGWRNGDKSSGTNYGIFYMQRENANSNWTVPVALPAVVNAPGYNTRQPFLTRDGKHLFFSSDRPGGYGKFDLWLINMEGAKPQGAAINLGKIINSDGEEASPFYDADSSRLFFSSDGRAGMGGLDIYRIYGTPENNQWSAEVTNMGYPYNSVKNDVYFSKDRYTDTAYLSSDRNSLCCLELYKAVPILYKDTAKLAPAVDSSDYWAKVVKEKQAQADSIARSVAEDNKVKQALMDSVNAATVERLYVNYNFASSAIRRVDHATLDRIVSKLKKDPQLNILVASFTDCIGSKENNERLSRRRSESVKEYLEKKGIASARINTDFFGKKHLILPCYEAKRVNIEEQIANRRSDLILTHALHPKWTPSGKELDIIGNENAGETGAVSVSAAYPTVSERKRITSAEGNRQVSGESKRITAGNKDVSIANKSAITDDNKAANNKAVATSKKKESDRGDEPTAFKLKKPKDKGTTIPKKAEPVVTGRREGFDKTVARRDVEKLPHKMNISSLVNMLPSIKSPDLVEEMTKRIPRKPLDIYSTSDSVRIDLYDNGVFDYDSVSVIYNKKLVVYKELLQTNKPITFYVNLNTDQTKNELIFFAENLGITPPNSALMIITDGNKRTEVNVTSDLEHNTVVYFIKVNKK